MDSAIKKIDGREIDITIDVDDRASDKINKIGSDLIDLEDVAKEIDLGSLDTSGMSDSDIRVGLEVDLDELDEVSKLIREMDELDEEITIGVKMDADRALADAAKLNAEIDALIDDTEKINVEVDTSGIERLQAGITRVTSSIGRAGTVGTLLGAISLIGPALVPLTGVAAGVAGGLVGSFGVIGTGLGGLAIFAIPTLKEISEGIKAVGKAAEGLEGAEKFEAMRDALSEVDKEIRPVVRAVISLQEAWEKHAASVKPHLIPMFVAGIRVAKSVLDDFAPIANNTADAITDLFDRMRQNLNEKGGDWQNFFTYVENNIGSFINRWGTAVGNFATGIANMIVAFDPLNQMVTDGFLSWSESFLKWSQNLENNQGFQSFVAYVQENGPKVADLFGSIIDAIINVGSALAPFGTDILESLTGVFDTISRIAEANPELVDFAAKLGAVAGAVALLSPLLSPLAKGLGALTSLGLGKVGGGLAGIAASGSRLAPVAAFLAGPGGILIALAAAIGAIGTALALTVDTGDAYNDMWASLKELWGTLKETGLKVWEIFKEFYEIFKDIGGIELFQGAIEDIAETLKILAPLLEPVAVILGGALLGAFMSAAFAVSGFAKAIRFLAEEVMGLVQPIIDAFMWLYDKLIGHSIIPDLVNGIRDWLAKLPGIAMNFLGKLKDKAIQKITGLVASVGNKLGKLKDNIVNRFSTAKNRAVKLAGDLKDGAVSRFERLRSAAAEKFNKFKESASSKFQSAKEAVKRKAGELKDSAVAKFEQLRSSAARKFEQFKSSASSKFQSAKDAVKRKAEEMRTAAVAKMADLVSGMGTKLSRAKSAVTNAFSGAGSWLYDKGRAIVEGIANGIRSAIGLVGSAMSAVGAKIAAHVPGSPVKEGPLTAFNDGSPGSKLMEMVAWGIERDDSIQKALNSLTSDIAPRFTTDPVTGLGNWGSLDRESPGANTMFGGGGNTYNIEVKAPVGSSSVDIGREIVKHIDAFENAGGRKRRK